MKELEDISLPGVHAERSADVVEDLVPLGVEGGAGLPAPYGQEAPAGATARAAEDTPAAPYLTRQERPCSWTGSVGSLINFRQTRLLWDFMLRF